MDAPQKVETPRMTQPPEPEVGLPASPLDRPAPSQPASRTLLVVAVVLAFAVGAVTALVASTYRGSPDLSKYTGALHPVEPPTPRRPPSRRPPRPPWRPMSSPSMTPRRSASSSRRCSCGSFVR